MSNSNPRQVSPFSQADVDCIRHNLTRKKRARDLALLEVSISTGLRVGDMLSLRVCDVMSGDKVNDSAQIRQSKTNRVVRVAITAKAQSALTALITGAKLTSPDYLFTSLAPGAKPTPMTSQSFRVIVKHWAEDICGHDADAFSAHSTRRTLAAHVYGKTHDLAACRLLLGHSSLAVTARYLGVAAEDAVQLVHNVAM